jgi:Ca-activated chloride channel family protein
VAASLPPDGAGTNAQSSTQSSPSDQNALAAAPTTGPATIAANPAAPASPPIAPARRQEIFAPASGLASSARDFDRVPVSENRGLLTFTAPTFNFDEIAPRYAATPVAKADATVSTTAGGEHDNEFISVAQQPVSTFAIDSDTAGYADVRNFLQKRQRPPRELVHIEEMLNFFPFGYAPPKGDAPFAASMEVADAPWLPAHRLVRIGLKAREVTATPRPPANLVFVLDVLTTERQRSQLPMIRESIEFLLGRLRADDRVSIVTTMNGASLVLPPTLAAKTPEIVAALARLGTLGSSSRAKGLQLAYEIARANFLPGSGNHVILCTDGNAATTITAEGPLARLIETQTKAGVTLTAFGFGMGLYRDPLIELLADYGKGNYAYIDTRRAAEKYLVEDINGPSVTVAKDVAVEVEFNPAKVARYRLIGYENRVLKKEDFKGDAFGADEISAGHAVTALFEIEPVAARAVAVTPALDPNELLTMKVRYKKPGGALARKIDFPLFDSRTRFVDASADFKFAAAVAGLGMILRDSPHKGLATLPQVIEWAEASAGNDPGGYRTEFVELAREAEKIRQ